MRKGLKRRISALLIASMILSLNAPVYAQDLLVDDAGSLIEEEGLINEDEALITEDAGSVEESLLSNAPIDAAELLDDANGTALPEGDESPADMQPVRAGNMDDPELVTVRIGKTFVDANIIIPKSFFPAGTTESTVESNYSLQMAAVDVTGLSNKTVSVDEIGSWTSATADIIDLEELGFVFGAHLSSLQAGREYAVCYKLGKSVLDEREILIPEHAYERIGNYIAENYPGYVAVSDPVQRDTQKYITIRGTTYTTISQGQVDNFKTVVSYTGSIRPKKDSVGYKDPAPFKDVIAPELAITLSENITIDKHNINIDDDKYDAFKKKNTSWKTVNPKVEMNDYAGFTHDFNAETGDVDLKGDDFLSFSYTITDPATGGSVQRTSGAVDATQPVASIIDYAKLSSNRLVSVNVDYLISGVKEAEASCELTIDQSQAYVYPILKDRESGNIKKDSGSNEFYVTAGKEIAYDDFATEIRLNEDPDNKITDGAPAIKDGGKVAFILTQGSDKKILLPAGPTVSFASVGPVTVKVSQNGVELDDPSCIFTEAENDKNNKLTVISPSLEISVKNQGLPYGYVTGELKKDFDIKKFVKVIDKNQGNKDVTDSSFINYKWTLSGPNAANVVYNNTITGGQVGDTLYVYVSYSDDSKLDAALASGISVVPQKITAYPEFVETDFTEDASKTVSSADIGSLSFIDEDGEVDEASEVTEAAKIKTYVSGDGIAKLDFVPTDRKLYNKLKYSKGYEGDGIMIPASIVQTADKPAGSYAITVEPCSYYINPMVMIYSEDIKGKRTADRYRGNDKSFDEFTGLSENDLKTILGEDVYTDASIPKYIKLRAVCDGTEGIAGEITVTTSFNNLANPSTWYTSDGFLNLEGHYSDGLTEIHKGVVSDVYVTIYAAESKYTGIAAITMDPINDVTYDGGKHVADCVVPGKTETADLNIHVYSNLGGVKRELIYGTDYTVSYKNNEKACPVDRSSTQNKDKWPTVTVTGKGAYKGMTIVEYFNINKADVDSIKVEYSRSSFKMDSKGNFTLTGPKYKVVAGGGNEKSLDNKDGVSFRIIRADSKLGLKDPENFGTQNGRSKGTYKGTGGVRMRMIISSQGSDNFNKGEALTDVFFYIYPSVNKDISAKLVDSKKSIKKWSDVKNIDKETGLRTVSACDFAGNETVAGWENLEVKVGKQVIDKKYYSVHLYADDKKTPIEGDATTQVGTYVLRIEPTEAGTTEGGLAPDPKYISVTYKATKKLNKAIDKKSVLRGYMTRFDTGYKGIPSKGMPIVDPSYGFKLSINKIEGLANDVSWEAYDLTGKTLICSSKDGGKASSKAGAVVNPGMTPLNVNPGTYKIIFYGSGAYNTNDKVTATYKVDKYDGKKNVRIRVVSGNEPGTIPYNKGGYIYEVYKDSSSPTGFSPYSTDDFGHVDLVLQTQVSENWVDNAYLTQNLKNAKVSVKIDKGGKAQVSVTGLKSDNGKTLASGTISNLAEEMTARSSLSGNSSIYLYNSSLVEKDINKFDNKILLYQYSAAKGIDEDGNYKSVKLNKGKDYEITKNKLEVGLSENSVTINGGSNGLFKKTVSGCEISNAGKDKKDWNKALAVGKDTANKIFKLDKKELFGNDGGLAYRNGLKCTHDSITIKDKNNNVLLTLDKKNGYRGVISDNGIDVMEVETVYANNTEIDKTAECTLIFTPLAKSDKAYIGSKKIKFKIK